jgi:uncharacterized protein YggE
MTRLLALLIPGLALAVLAVACTDKDTTMVTTSAESTGISVSGRGEAVGVPDVGFFDVGVDVVRPTVAEARDRAAEVASVVLDSLKDNGVEEKDVLTTGISIYPEYSFPPDAKQPVISGYHVTNTAHVTVRDLDRFSELVDDAVAAGGDDVRVSGLGFDIEDREALVREARAAAMTDARAKAEQLAELGEVTLGVPLSISESTASESPVAPGEGRDDAGGGGPTPIEPGTAKVIVVVQVRWAVE